MIKNCLSNLINIALNTAKNLTLPIILAVLVLVTSILLSHLLYSPKTPFKKGFSVEITEIDRTPIKIGAATAGDSADSAESQVDIAALIAQADLKAGEKIFKKCKACHSVNPADGNKVGPNLHGVVGRGKAAIAGFKYSDALKDKGGVWSVEDLNKWIANPKNFISGNKMAFAGLSKDQDRANVIAYLKIQK